MLYNALHVGVADFGVLLEFTIGNRSMGVVPRGMRLAPTLCHAILSAIRRQRSRTAPHALPFYG